MVGREVRKWLSRREQKGMRQTWYQEFKGWQLLDNQCLKQQTGLWKLTEISDVKSSPIIVSISTLLFPRDLLTQWFSRYESRRGGVPRVWCRIHEKNYLEQQEVVLDLVIDPYIHIDNSSITCIVIEPNILDLEDPRLIDTSQYFSLWCKVYTVRVLC